MAQTTELDKQQIVRGIAQTQNFSERRARVSTPESRMRQLFELDGFSEVIHPTLLEKRICDSHTPDNPLVLLVPWNLGGMRDWSLAEAGKAESLLALSEKLHTAGIATRVQVFANDSEGVNSDFAAHLADTVLEKGFDIDTWSGFARRNQEIFEKVKSGVTAGALGNFKHLGLPIDYIISMTSQKINQARNAVTQEMLLDDKFQPIGVNFQPNVGDIQWKADSYFSPYFEGIPGVILPRATPQ